MAVAGTRQWKSGRWTRTKLTLIDIEKAHVSGKLSEGEFAYASAPN